VIAKLEMREELFLCEYLIDGDPDRAAEAAGYQNPRRGRQLLRSVPVQRAIAEALDRRRLEGEQNGGGGFSAVRESTPTGMAVGVRTHQAIRLRAHLHAACSALAAARDEIRQGGAKAPVMLIASALRQVEVALAALSPAPSGDGRARVQR
jgi:hypothetical protein